MTGKAPASLSAARVIRNVVLGAAQQGLSIAVGLVLTPLLLIHLGLEQYGVLATAELLSISGLLGNFEFGLQGSIVRHLAGYHAAGERDKFRHLLATGFVIFLLIGLGCGLVLLAFSHYAFFRVFVVPPSYREAVEVALLIYVVTFPLQFAIYVLKAFFLAVHDFPRLTAWASLERGIFLAAVALVLSRRGGIVAIVAAEQVVVVGLAVVFAIVAAWRFPEFTIDVRLARRSSLRGVVELGWQAFLSHMQTNVVYQKAPEIITASMLGPSQLAYLSALLKVTMALKTLGSAIGATVTPAAAAFERLELRRRMAQLTLRGVRYAYFGLTPLLSFLAFFAPAILALWLGPSFVPLANLLRALVAWQYAMFLVQLLRASFTRVDQFRRVAGATLAGNVAFLAVAIALTAIRNDLWGVALGLLVSVAITLVGYLRVLGDSTSVTLGDLWQQSIKGPILAVGLGTIAAWWVLSLVAGESIWDLAAIFIVVSSVAAWLVFRYALNNDERVQLSRAAARLAGRPS